MSDNVFSTRVAGLSPAKRTLLERSLLAGNSVPVELIPRRPPAEPVAPSFAQERLWFLAQLDPGSALYNVPLGLRLRGGLDVGALRAALWGVVGRHEALRTCFPAREGRPVQLVLDRVELPLPRLEVESEREAERLAGKLAAEPFDLARAPLLRAQLLRLGEDDHLLVLSLHHIVFDGWSLGVLLGELSELYNARRAGRPPRLAPLAIQYPDYAVWQRQQLQPARLEQELGYWRTQLAGAPELLELPADRPRPAVRSFRGGRVSRSLPAGLSQQLNQLAQREQTTLFIVLLAGLQALLARLSDQLDLSIGTPVAGREHPQTEPLIGFFANTLVLRAQLDDNPSFRRILRAARTTTLDALSHQTLPFEQLVEHLHPERTLNRTPLFQIVLNFQTTVAPSPFECLGAEPLDIDNGTSMFDLTVVAEPYPTGLKLSAQYSADLFEAETVERLLGHLETLLAGAVGDPEARLAQLPLLSDEQRWRLLVEWNRTGREYPRDRCVHDLIEDQARRRPEAPAVEAAGETLSYGELERRAAVLAGRLRRLGIGPESVVAVLLEREPRLVVALLAVLKAGGAFLPLDPTNPPQRLAYQLADSGARLVVSMGELVRGLELPAATRPLLLDEAGEGTGGSGEHGAALAQPENLAYLIYTSGSTGAPKGALLEHRGLMNLVAAKIHDFDVGSATRTLQFAALGFDALVSEVFVTLAAGGTLCLAERERLLPGPPLARLLRERQITMVTLPPSALAVLDPDDLPLLRTVLSAGERCTAEIVARWAPRRSFFNGYGPTEVTVGATLERCINGSARPTIGRPIANKEAFVLDERLEPVPVGVPGELYVGGIGLARGYHRRPDLTAERFLPHPYSSQSGARLYRTGDRARYLPDGRLEFLGRVDNQIKIRGYRVEPAEIEATLRRHPQVADALVTTHPDAEGRPLLIAYLTPLDPADPPDPHQLRVHLHQHLPSYMHPAHYQTLDRFPLTPSGKPDRAKLPPPTPSSQQPHAPPRTPTETQLAQIWATTLNHTPIGIHDNFFELGGDSIQSVQVVARANEQGLPMTPRMMFEHQTIAALATALVDAPVMRAEQGLVVGPALLLPSQRWFFEQDFADQHHWNQAVLLELRRRLDPAILRETVRVLLGHHDVLRARFCRNREGWEQSLSPPSGDTPVEAADLSHLAPDARATAIEAAAAEAQASLDLAQGPLLKLVLFDLGEGDPGRLLIVAHHLVIDGISWLVLQEDIERAYLRLERGERAALPRKTTSVREWAERLHEAARSPEICAQRSRWVDLVARRVPELLTDDVPGSAADSPGGDSLALRLPHKDTDLLLGASRSARGRADESLLAALGLTFARWTGANSVLVEVEQHGRDAVAAGADASRTIGWLTTTCPALLQLETVNAVGAVAAARAVGYAEGGASYALLRYLAGDPVLRAWPGPQVGFTYLGTFDGARGSELVKSWTPQGIGPLQSRRARRPHLIDVAAFVVGGRLELNIAWSTAAWRRASIERLVDELRRALAEVAAHVGATIAERTAADFPLARLDDRQLERLALVLDRTDARPGPSTEPDHPNETDR